GDATLWTLCLSGSLPRARYGVYLKDSIPKLSQPQAPGAMYLADLLKRGPIRSGRVEAALLIMCVFRGGSFMSLRELRARLGLKRGELVRAFALEGLPHPRVVQESLRVLALLEWWERTGETPGHFTLRLGEDPAVFYRLVRRVTGQTWTAVRERGSKQFLDDLLLDWEEHTLRRTDGRTDGRRPGAWMKQLVPRHVDQPLLLRRLPGRQICE